MLTKRLVVPFIIMGVILFCMARENQAQDDKLKIKVLKGRLSIALALPDFVVKGGGSEAADAAGEIATLVRSDLEFARLFDLAPPSVYQDIPPHDESSIPWDKYAEHQVEAIALGNIRIEGGNIVAEVRLFDRLQQKMVFGKRVTSRADRRREVAHRVAGHIIYHLSGDWGVFDKKIIFTSTRGVGSTGMRSEIWVMDFDGHGQQRVTFSESLNISPSFGPGNSGIVYTRIVEGSNADIYRLPLSGGAAEKFITTMAIDHTPAISPDGKKIAYASSVGGNMDIYVVDLEDSALRSVKLTQSGAIDLNPAWSPDGTKIAFSSSRTGRPQIYLMNADGSSERRLTYEGVYNDGPTWNPDGTMIAYAARRPDSRFDIRIHDLTTGDTYYVTNDVANDEDPSWSPDGRWIAFASDRGGRGYQIYLVGIDGRNLRQLTNLGENKHPSWSW